MADVKAGSGPDEIEQGQTDGAPTEPSTSRRRLIQIGAVGASAMVGGAVADVLSAPAANAATGGNMIIGQSNSVTIKGTQTTLTDGPFVVSGPTGGVGAVQGNGFPGVVGTGASASATGVSGSGSPGVVGTGTTAAAPGVQGSGAPGVLGHGSAAADVGVQGTSSSGSGVHADGGTGRGVVASGGTAQIQLIPGSGATHPASGAAGDIYVDSSARAWFCQGGTAWVQLTVAGPQGPAGSQGSAGPQGSAGSQGPAGPHGPALMRLIPSSSHRPPRAGQAGQLFVDASDRLWFCKKGGARARWKQIA